MRAHSEAVAVRLGWHADKLDELRLGAALHDVGKVFVPPQVLAKPGAPRRAGGAGGGAARTLEGAWLVAGVPLVRARRSRTCSTTTSAGTARLPDRARRDEIPLEARILAVADAFDAMTSAPAVPRALRPT